MWTLTLPIFLVTCISFAQFGVAEQSLHDRLSVTLTTILTIIAFQVVVRDKVPAVPYRTLMDDYMLVSLGVMTLQVLGDVVVMAIHMKYFGAEGPTGETDEERMTRARHVDRAFLGVCTAWWLGAVLRFWSRTHAWRRELAWFDDKVDMQAELEDAARVMHSFDARDAVLAKKLSMKGNKTMCGDERHFPAVRGQPQEEPQVVLRKRQVFPLDNGGTFAADAEKTPPSSSGDSDSSGAVATAK